MVVTVQLEVAKRLAAGPGTRDYGVLSVWMQAVYDVAVRKTVSRTCFWPKPDVESAVVDMKRLDTAPVALKDRSVYYRLTKYAFMHRRKQLATILSRGPDCLNMPLARGRKLLEELGIDARARPENLAVADWCRLALRLTRD